MSLLGDLTSNVSLSIYPMFMSWDLGVFLLLSQLCRYWLCHRTQLSALFRHCSVPPQWCLAEASQVCMCSWGLGKSLFPTAWATSARIRWSWASSMCGSLSPRLVVREHFLGQTLLSVSYAMASDCNCKSMLQVWFSLCVGPFYCQCVMALCEETRCPAHSAAKMNGCARKSKCLNAQDLY